MTVPMKLVQKLVLVLGVFGHAMIVAQNVTVGDTVWYVAYLSVVGYLMYRLVDTRHLLSVIGSVEGYVMDTLCIQLGTLLDNPEVVTLAGPGNHSFHWYVDATT
jgi:hypothetical protein